MNETLTSYLLEKIGTEPVHLRVALYRALAAQTADKVLASNCRSIANLLEDVERNHLQLTLDLKRRMNS
jgi:hypothetical protein